MNAMPLIKHVAGERIVLYDLEEASAMLGICQRTLREYSYREIIPACRLRRKLYFTDKNLSAFLRGAKSTRRKSTVPAPRFETDDFPPDPMES